ncbi:Protein of unknown function [Pyronema omphalodes CBS 100304]|uniref:Uncharacterized protein n=1 Tax=Pyronema omphalodes (strain CBS 100304) TaxID=1076935 RepID=U4KZB7_PYROM|nr:Protein of unknown function [Pyronema omphalodes CBS 100304]
MVRDLLRIVPEDAEFDPDEFSGEAGKGQRNRSHKDRETGESGSGRPPKDQARTEQLTSKE